LQAGSFFDFGLTGWKPIPHLSSGMVVGLDIGGANIKASDGRHCSLSLAFPLWQKKDSLADAVTKVIARFQDVENIALTMTGELADCFETKREGVQFIVDAVKLASPQAQCSVYATNGEFLASEDAVKNWHAVAAANWFAIATLSANLAKLQNGLVIDIGSTTTDIIPIIAGRVASQGKNDLTRLLNSELAYTGVKRTPVCAIVDCVAVDEVPCPVAKEFFATAYDAYLVSGLVPEDVACHDSADGRPNTKIAAAQRLARMVCSDRDELGWATIESIADSIIAAQCDQITQAINTVIAANGLIEGDVVVSGSGAFLLKRIVSNHFSAWRSIDFSKLTGGQDHSDCAAAFAVAHLLQESVKRESAVIQ
jgi:(4-(4-[2-(gamma-L-glutamylamino)ethyl]phenoxymethyl)furan-2-yl)methanamine synthase